eukprot:TRINITY_DN51241_c0_g1_i1.p1 TRINITY_DN51241_c0_g1~~TRINITY_DN51241_c0_g1_i1.p1  ORF type:complete len:316 (-),score=92.31 TRINITY_DN51241_c0_g1_i1:204-1151(-)
MCIRDRDVGAGTGILSIWAARAGARKVYAVEATGTANHARDLVAANGMGEVVEVIQAKMEDVELPEKVDIIVSEWMGYFLVYESMLDTVILARDKWLLPGGALYPSHAQVFMAPLKSPDRGTEKAAGMLACMDDWGSFVDESQKRYGVDMTPLSQPYTRECDKFFMRTANEWVNLAATDLSGQPACITDIDCHTVTLEDLVEIRSEFVMPLTAHSRLVGIAGWFDVHFRGSEEAPASKDVTLSTHPRQGYTHWGHTYLMVHPAPMVQPEQLVRGSIHVTRQKEDQRRLNVEMKISVGTGVVDQEGSERTLLYTLD